MITEMKPIKRLKMNRILVVGWLLVLPFLLGSCSVAIPDEAYMDGHGQIDHEQQVSSSRVHGMWVRFSTTAIGHAATGKETRSHFKFDPGGGGKVREINKFLSTGSSIILEAPLRWERIGPNRWRVDLPATDRYRVIKADGAEISGQRQARSFRMAYANGRLYDIDNLKTLVPYAQAIRHIDAERARVRGGHAMPFVFGFD
jgi:hypothetical protein